MKKLYIFTAALLFSFSLQAQIINIPDANFKNALTSTICCNTGVGAWTDADFNNDGEIQTSEALQIVSMNVDNESITSLLGIESFTNLESLRCNDNQITSLDLSNLINLSYLYCENNDLNSLDLSGLENMINLNCRDNQLTSLELGGLVNIEELNCRNNQLSVLNIADFTNLKRLYCQDNLLENLTIPNSIELLNVDCNNNQLTSLQINASDFSSLDCSNNLLTSLNLSSMESLNSLTCNNNQLTSLDVSTMTTLNSLICQDNQLTSLILGNLNINQIVCGNNLLTELTVNSTTLYNLSCNNNQLTVLNINNAPNLHYLYCGNNLLTSLDFSNQSSFGTLDCSNNNLTTLDVSNLQSIEDLIVDNNELTSINLCPITWETLSVRNNFLTEIDISNSPNLEGIFCENNLLTSLDISNNSSLINLYASDNEFTSLNFGNAESLAWEYDVFFDGNPNLSVVCTIEENFDQVQNKLTEFGYTDVAISSYCSFEPNGEYYIVQGETTFDSNNDGCDVSDIAMQNVNYNITSNSINDSFISNTDGTFTLYIDSGSHTIAPNFENPEYYSASPSSLTVNFPSDTSPFVQDFCVTANGSYHDLEVAVLPLEGARPGFDTDYKIVYKNKGTTTLSGSVDLTFQDDIMDFVSATPSQDAQTGGMLSWNFTDLAPFEVREITFTMGLNAPTDTPPVNGDDILVYEASVNHSETDETPDDNTAVFNQTVVNSFDPNDKTCLKGDYITPEEVGKYVDYLIRFENTGTASAVNIVVKDDIDITKYDLSTLVPLHASHDFFARIKDQGNDHYIEFIFEDINLPFDDANNDGYVAFKIKTLETLVLGDSFDNNAEIYFDYNFPIITDEATTTVAALSIDEFGFADNGMVLYPNPTTNILNLESKQPIEHVTIFDISGRTVQEIAVLGTKHKLEISTEKLIPMTYFVKIETETGESVRKVIKN
ncbi:T9SS type A sorting domain-containing protein [Hanstruepera ponticola]|uniref:T9SS type A sorting domain-containing protein n=1 Tax=Hanstruepera ponticola TaxID=2042995 RepID=UPI00177AAFA5|nr:T9SS type A sorting domain-containing protein [Hanstruepera ponticola]